METDGFMRVYTIESDFGEYRAHGDEMLETRIAEIRALATLQELSAGEEFAAALGRSLKSPFVAAWNLVTKPVSKVAESTATEALTWRAASLLETPVMVTVVVFSRTKPG